MTIEEIDNLVQVHRDKILKIFRRSQVVNIRYFVSEFDDGDFLAYFFVDFIQPNLLGHMRLKFDLQDVLGVEALVLSEESTRPEYLSGILERIRPL